MDFCSILEKLFLIGLQNSVRKMETETLKVLEVLLMENWTRVEHWPMEWENLIEEEVAITVKMLPQMVSPMVSKVVSKMACQTWMQTVKEILREMVCLMKMEKVQEFVEEKVP